MNEAKTFSAGTHTLESSADHGFGTAGVAGVFAAAQRRSKKLLPALLSALMLAVYVFLAAPPASAALLWSWMPSPFSCDAADNGCVSGTGFDPSESTWGQLTNANGNCTNYVAYRLASNGATRLTGNGDASTWRTRVESQFGSAAANTVAAVGSVAWWAGTASNPSGHVGYVESVNGNSIHVSESRWSTGSRRRILTAGQSSYPDAFLHIHDASSGGGPAATPTILKVKRTADPNGIRQVYAATSGTITEGWWIPGGDGVHTAAVIDIAQNNIVDFDKTNLPEGKQAVYTAVPDGVWETWWGQGTGLHHNKILSGLQGVRQVIAANRWDGSQYVHRLYILAQNGPYEATWVDGGQGIQLALKNSIAGAIAMIKTVAPNGDDQLYVATPTWVYEIQWNTGNAVQARTIINISEADIRSLEKGDNLPDGGQLLYTTTNTTVWQSYWLGASAASHGTIATSQNGALQAKKAVTAGVHQVYLATADHVQEYWWHGSGSGSGGSELIRISQNTIKAIDKATDGSTQQLYTGAADAVWETYWGGGVSPASSVLFQVSR